MKLALALVLRVKKLFCTCHDGVRVVGLAMGGDFSVTFCRAVSGLIGRLPCPSKAAIACVPVGPCTSLPTSRRGLQNGRCLTQVLGARCNMRFPVSRLTMMLGGGLGRSRVSDRIMVGGVSAGARQALTDAGPTFGQDVNMLMSRPFFVSHRGSVTIRTMVISPCVLVLGGMSLLCLFAFNLVAMMVYDVVSRVGVVVHRRRAVGMRRGSFCTLTKGVTTPISTVPTGVTRRR